MVELDQGKTFWKCLWCKKKFQGKHASKAVAHVAKVKGMEWIRVKTSKGERVQGGWCILAAPKDLEKPTDDDYQSFNVGADSCIYYLIRRYHKSRMELNLDETNYKKDGDETDSDGSDSDTEVETED